MPRKIALDTETEKLEHIEEVEEPQEDLIIDDEVYDDVKEILDKKEKRKYTVSEKRKASLERSRMIKEMNMQKEAMTQQLINERLKHQNEKKKIQQEQQEEITRKNKKKIELMN
jgi:hypothetical protein